MKALFVVPFRIGTLTISGTALLPDLTEIIDGKVRDGCGWSCLGNVPQAKSAIVLVDSSAATIAKMKIDPGYLFLEDIADPPIMPKIWKALTDDEKKIAKDLLKTYKHNAIKVDNKKIDTDIELIEAVLDLHGVTVAEYQAAGGTL